VWPVLRRPSATRALRLFAVSGLLPAVLLCSASSAFAEPTTWLRFSDQPAYRLELEPHLVVGAANPPGPGAGQGAGAGVRGSVMLSRDGFIAGVNDSIALGFGLDVLRYGGGGSFWGTCVARTPGPAGTSVCTAVDSPGGARGYLFIPVVMQWNFWFTKQWSAFGEPGVDIFFTSHGGGATPSLAIGGRLHVTEAVAIVLRLGWPTTTFGASFSF